MSRVIYSRPSRPPDSTGRESYVYLMDGASVRNIRDLPIDDLAPWNSRICKSSTRFNAIHTDESGHMVLRRYIVSDTENVPEKLLACYYCKHPVFGLAKKIFYACDGHREACLPGTFAVFVYEFDRAEKLYIRGTPSYTQNTSRQSLPSRNLTPNSGFHFPHLSSTPLAGGNSRKNQSMIAGGFGNDVFETRAALDAICGGSGGGAFGMGDGSGFGEEEDFTEFSDSKLEELLQLSQFHADSMQKPPFQSSRSALAQQLSQNNGNGYPTSKRRKMSHLQPANFAHPIASAYPDFLADKSLRSSFMVDTKNFRVVHISEAMLSNFQLNCLCEADKVTELFEKMDENMTDMASELCGGCLLLDTAFPIGKYFVTIVWFRNPMFLQEGVPVVHPAAVLISHETKPSDYEFLLGELSKKLGKQDKICRSVLLPESVNLDALSQQPDIFHYPCIKLNCTNDFRTSLETRFCLSESESLKQIVEEELFGKINPDDLSQSTGLLNALKFEVFVKQLSQVEKKWPAPFRTWFREKSGWIFERLSLAARLKSGFGPKEVADVRKMTLQLKDNFIEKAAILMGPEDELDQQQIISAVEEFSTELLVKCAKSLIDRATEANAETGEKTIELNPAKDYLKAGQTQWLKCSQKREKLLEVGLSYLPTHEIFVPPEALDPELFTGLSCLEKLAMLSKAYELTVHAVEDGEKSIAEGSEQSSFTVIDHPCKSSFYVQCTEDSASSSLTIYCQCNPNSSPEALVMCEHFCAVALSEAPFAEKLTRFSHTCLENTKKAEEMSKANSVETIGSNDDEVKFLPSGLPLMMGSAGVEIIRCSSTSITENYRGKEEEQQSLNDQQHHLAYDNQMQMDDFGSRSVYSNGIHNFNSGQRLLLKRENGKYNIH